MHPVWGTYPDTVLQFPGAGVHIDLRQPVSPRALQALGNAGLTGSFAVVTACDPLGGPVDQSANQRLSAVLTALVQDRYPGATPVNGVSPDGTHVETGWAIPAPLEEIRGLAARFLQNAIYWFDGARFSIVPVTAAGPELMLPVAPADRAAGR